MTITALF